MRFRPRLNTCDDCGSVKGRGHSAVCPARIEHERRYGKDVPFHPKQEPVREASLQNIQTGGRRG